MLKQIFFKVNFVLILSFILLIAVFPVSAQIGSLKNLKDAARKANEEGIINRTGVPAENKITPDELIKELNGKSKPVVIQVGFKILYQQGHIQGAYFAGPASRNEGIAKLDSLVKKIPHKKEIVIYCGCCGWTDCPNIHPALAELTRKGFKNIKLLYLPNNFKTDWVDKGLPLGK